MHQKKLSLMLGRRLRLAALPLSVLMAVLLVQACATIPKELTPVEVNRRLNAGGNPNEVDEDGKTLLINAILQRRPDSVRLLLERGADPNMTDKDGLAPILYATGSLETQMVSDLIARGARVDATEPKSGETALHMAAGVGHVEAFPLLLKAGASIHARDKDGRTALHTANNFEPTMEVYRACIDAGVDITVRSATDETVLHAVMNGDKKRQVISKSLAIFYLFNLATHKAQFLPRDTAHVYRSQIAADLARKMPQSLISLKENSGNSPLYLALYYDHIEAAEILYSRHADLSSVTKEGRSILWAATRAAGQDERSFALFVKILDESDDINQASSSGFTPLHVAALNGHTNVIKKLLEKNADRTMKTAFGQTAKDLALEEGHVEAAKLLE